MASCLGFFFFFQAEDGIRDLVRSRGLGDVYKRQAVGLSKECDALVLVISEETGGISIAQRGRLVRGLSLIHI